MSNERLPSGIGEMSERGLHRYIKRMYSDGDPACVCETRVDGKIADIARYSGGEIVEVIEVQTRGLYKIVDKVKALSRSRPVRLVHPIISELSIVTLDPDGQVVSGPRKSPKKGDVWTLFDELVRACPLLGIKGVSIELVFVRASEVRVRDGTGSWRRKGVRLAERDVVEVLARRTFAKRADWCALIPKTLEDRFTSTEFAGAAGIGAERARRVLYCLDRAGVVGRVGKRGRSVEWEKIRRRAKKAP